MQGKLEAPEKPRSKALESGTVYKITGWRRLVFIPSAIFIRLYLASLRMKPASNADREALHYSSGPVLVTIWHNRSLLLPEMLRRYRPKRRIFALISASRMAAWEACFYKFMGMDNIRGSSTRRSVASTREMLKAVKHGHDLAISPDGPSGPIYTFRKGAIKVASKTNGRFLLVSAEAKYAKRLKTWDRHLLPLPFSTVCVKARLTEPYNDLELPEENDAAKYLRDLFIGMHSKELL